MNLENLYHKNESQIAETDDEIENIDVKEYEIGQRYHLIN